MKTHHRLTELRREAHVATGLIDGLAQLPKYAIVGVLILVVDRLDRLIEAVNALHCDSSPAGSHRPPVI